MRSDGVSLVLLALELLENSGLIDMERAFPGQWCDANVSRERRHKVALNASSRTRGKFPELVSEQVSGYSGVDQQETCFRFQTNQVLEGTVGIA